MKADFVTILECPARDCNGTELVLNASQVDTILYKDGPTEEVREGSLDCAACGRSYPISEYVPSFEQLFPPDLQSEAEYWGKWYGFMWQRGYLGFFDLRAPMAPLITEGIEVLDPATLERKDLGGSHSMIADHPGFAEAAWLLDIGCGTGWSSLYFARRGHKVAAFDPSVANMRLAKRYAISQGEYVEYIGAGMGFLQFKLAVFDAAVALHSIHHVPDLPAEMLIMRDWLKDGAHMGVDEHVRNDEVLMSLGAAMRRWAQEEVYPPLRTLPPGVLEGLPRAEPSAMEGAGSEDVIGAFLDNFEVETYNSRYISLDSFSFNFYLSHHPDTKAYYYSSNVIGRIYSFMKESYPDGAEYVILIGKKSKEGEAPNTDNELAIRARNLSNGYTTLIQRLEQQLMTAQDNLEATRRTMEEQHQALIAKNKHIGELENWAHRLERDLRAAQNSPLERATKRVNKLLRRRR
ncbi:MAG: class I SAM-dependent methyltransferase [Chloroflexota bacterium]